MLDDVETTITRDIGKPHKEALATEFSREDGVIITARLEDIDLENKQAYKGDNSDGKVDWNVRKIASAFSLACLYTGMIQTRTITLSAVY